MTYISAEIERAVHQFMRGAMEYANASRSVSGNEFFGGNGGKGWFTNIELVDYKKPFFRTVSGHSHTYFVFDIDTKVINNFQSTLYTDTDLRKIRLTTVMKEFSDKLWKDKFFGYMSGQGTIFRTKIR